MENGIYSISGMFYETLAGVSPFGGFFQLNNTSLEGMLTDQYGHSTIAGTLTDTEFKFEKKYKGKEDLLINYELTQTDRGLWKGQYKIETRWGGERKERAIAKINLDWSGTTIEQVHQSPEKFAEKMIASMVESGMLEVVSNQ